MTSRHAPRPFVVALSMALALSVLAGAGLGIALTSPPAAVTTSL